MDKRCKNELCPKIRGDFSSKQSFSNHQNIFCKHIIIPEEMSNSKATPAKRKAEEKEDKEELII